MSKIDIKKLTLPIVGLFCSTCIVKLRLLPNGNNKHTFHRRDYDIYPNNTEEYIECDACSNEGSYLCLHTQTFKKIQTFKKKYIQLRIKILKRTKK